MWIFYSKKKDHFSTHRKNIFKQSMQNTCIYHFPDLLYCTAKTSCLKSWISVSFQELLIINAIVVVIAWKESIFIKNYNKTHNTLFSWEMYQFLGLKSLFQIQSFLTDDPSAFFVHLVIYLLLFSIKIQFWSIIYLFFITSLSPFLTINLWIYHFQS